MTWFRVDDGFAMHPKVMEAGNAAIGLWLRAGTWSAAQLTDGLIPARVIRLLGARKPDAERLVQVGLWDRSGDGYSFHDWSEYQPSSSEVRSKRAENAERQAAWRARKREAKQASQNGKHPDVSQRLSQRDI